MELSSDLREDNLLEVTVRNVKTVIKCKTALCNISQEGLNIIWMEEEENGEQKLLLRFLAALLVSMVMSHSPSSIDTGMDLVFPTYISVQLKIERN